MAKESTRAKGRLEGREKGYYITSFVLGSFLILIAIFLIYYSKNPELTVMSRDTRQELLRDLGIALFISAILIVTVEIITRRLHFKESEILRKKLSKDILATILEQFTPEEIRGEVFDYILKSDFYYKNYEKAATAEEVSSSNEMLLKFTSITTVEVHNPTNQPKEYVTPIFLYDIDIIKDLPEPIIDSLEIKDKEDNVLYDSDKDKSGLTLEKDKDKGQLRIKTKRIIPPNSHISVRRVDTVFLRRAKDYFRVVITKPTVNFKLNFKFPNANYKFWCIPNRPGSQEKGRFSVDVREKENRIEAKANGGLLPYQGLILKYIYLKQ